MIKCQLTGRLGSPIKAHIIPRAFYEIPPQSEGPMLLAGNDPASRVKKAPVGIYDRKILTAEGEEIISRLDDYAANCFLHRRYGWDPVMYKSNLVAWTIEKADYATIKLFALSLLWRANASDHSFFAKIRLGEHEPKIRQLIVDNNPGSENQYEVSIASWIDNNYGAVQMNPSLTEMQGLDYYVIYCGRMILYIKIDSQQAPDHLRVIQIGQDSPVCVVARSFLNSKELPILKSIVNTHKR